MWHDLLVGFFSALVGSVITDWRNKRRHAAENRSEI